MNDEKWVSVAVIFITTSVFASLGWLNKRVRSKDYVEGKTSTRTKIEGFTHSMISSLIAVLAFSAISHFYPTWELLFQGSLAVVCGAFLSEALIKLAEKRINDDNIL